MLLAEIGKYPDKALMYLERYVNDGSPSGFTQKFRTSPETDPFNFNPYFYLYKCEGPSDYFETYGEIPSNCIELANNPNEIYVHPDLIQSSELFGKNILITLNKTFRVVPTSSSRTIQVYDKKNPFYLKLHYEGILGRVNREIPRIKAISGPELSRIISNSIDKNMLCEKLYLFKEFAARILFVKESKKEIGLVCRDYKPYGKLNNKISYIIPFFSLFSLDRLSSYAPPLLLQILDISKENPFDYVLNKLLIPIIESYFSLVFQLGLQPEWNAQNLLIGLNDNFSIDAIIMRDLGRIEKDITLRNKLSLRTDFDSFPYKCIDENMDIYKIRHSFAFDFKLGEYIIAPIIDLMNTHFNIPSQKFEKNIKEFVNEIISINCPSFFPENNMWYKHDDVMLDKTRPYIATQNPRFRN